MKTLLLFVLFATSALGQDNLYTSDGPAELPRTHFDTRLSSTPSSGTVVPLAAGSDITTGYAALQCGQTLSLAHGATFKLPANLPAKNCPDSAWITITSDGVLPPEGTRVTPAVLPQMAVLMASAGGGSGMTVNADHIRFVGLAFMKPVGSRILSDFVQVADGAHDIIFDRNYLHGNPKEELTRGIIFAGVTRFAAIDNWIDEAHCIAVSGSCSDSQAIASLGGSVPVGPIKIVNNYLQASGENVLFGGGAAAYPVADVEIRRNHFEKPLSWLDPTAMGTTKYIVKNLLELKNAQRVLVEGNTMSGSWGGFSQAGFAIVLTPKNQAGANGSNLCPACIVTDVTIRYNAIAHVGAGFGIANVLSDNGGAALDGQRYSIHDVVIDDISGTKYAGSGELAEIATEGVGEPLLQNVTIDHVTAFPAHFLLVVGALVTAPMQNFVFTNNLVSSGTYPVWNMGGGTASCAFNDVPVSTIAACFKPGVFAGNVIAANLANYPASKWPAGNFIVTATGFDTNFVNYANGSGGDYHLSPTNGYKGKALDGKDPGADVDLVAQYTKGVN